MTHVTYKIVEHDGGWAYTVNGVFSEPFATHAAALTAINQRPPALRDGLKHVAEEGRARRQ